MVKKSKKPCVDYPIDQQREDLHRAQIDLINKWRPALRKQKLEEILRDSTNCCAQMEELVNDKLKNLNQIKTNILQTWDFSIDSQTKTVDKYQQLTTISTSWIEEEIRQTVIECDSIHQKTLLTLENLEQQCNIRLAEIQLQSKQQEMELLQKSESIKLANDRQLLQREAELSREISSLKYELDTIQEKLELELATKQQQVEMDLQPLNTAKTNKEKEIKRLRQLVKNLSDLDRIEQAKAEKLTEKREADSLEAAANLEDLTLQEELEKRKRELEQSIAETKTYWLAKAKQISVEFEEAEKQLNRQMKMADKAIKTAHNQLHTRRPSLQHHFIPKWQQNESQKLIMLPLLA